MKITNQKFQTFYPNQYSPEEQAALDDLRKTVAERGGVGPMADRTVTADQSKMLDTPGCGTLMTPSITTQPTPPGPGGAVCLPCPAISLKRTSPASP